MSERRSKPKPGTRVAVHACSGETASARLAQDIAERLSVLLAGSASGERVIAIDGCGSACASRKLAAQGLETETVSLDLLGVELGGELEEQERAAMTEEIASRLGSGRGTSSRRPPRRRPDPPARSAASVTATHTPDDYLFAISLLTSPVGACGAVASDVPTLASHVARALGVSRASAGEKLLQIEAAGEIERSRDKAIVLTERGRAAADLIVARHRVVERFLADVLGYSAGESHALALQVRGTLPADVIERLRGLVAHASTCPHGWPLEPGTGIERAAGLVALSALPTGACRSVAALAEHDSDLLARLCARGLDPGVDVEVISGGVAPTIIAGGATLRLDAHEAAAVLVLLSPPAE